MKEQNSYCVDETKWKEEFSKKINKLLNKKNVSINKVASDIDADPKTLRNYINCENIPSAIMVIKLAKYFDVSIDYLVLDNQNNISYSDETILALGTLIKNFDVSLVKGLVKGLGKDNEESDDTIILKIKDKIIATIVKEMYLTRNSSDFHNIVNKLMQYYGKMIVYDNHLIDYHTFQNLIRHKYVYDNFEYEMELADENGTEFLGVDAYTLEEIEEREIEWENMSFEEREKWWKEFNKS